MMPLRLAGHVALVSRQIYGRPVSPGGLFLCGPLPSFQRRSSGRSSGEGMNARAFVVNSQFEAVGFTHLLSMGEE